MMPNLAILAAAVILFTAQLTLANLLQPLPRRAAWIDLRFQPVMDFDKDSCVNVAAVDEHGNTNEGLDPGDSDISDCRSDLHPWHSNSYSRHMCNRGWCAILYCYYFEMDSVSLGIFGNKGHRHDWEHVVVWAENEVIKYVATSCHGDFDIHPASDVRFEGTRPKIVYHKDGVSTRCLRLATEADDDIENPLGKWFDSFLVDWSGFPSFAVRDALVSKSWGSAHMEYSDADIGAQLAQAMPSEAQDAAFDTSFDDGRYSF